MVAARTFTPISTRTDEIWRSGKLFAANPKFGKSRPPDLGHGPKTEKPKPKAPITRSASDGWFIDRLLVEGLPHSWTSRMTGNLQILDQPPIQKNRENSAVLNSLSIRVLAGFRGLPRKRPTLVPQNRTTTRRSHESAYGSQAHDLSPEQDFKIPGGCGYSVENGSRKSFRARSTCRRRLVGPALKPKNGKSRKTLPPDFGAKKPL